MSTSKQDDAVSGVTNDDSSLDALLREVARTPARKGPTEAPGARWGEGGRYVITRVLGRGGMGVVYAAEDTVLHRAVALKVLEDPFERGTPQRDRLMKEARLAAQVEHERVARVYDVGEHDGAAFVAMELVRGTTLRAWMNAGSHSIEESTRVIVQIAEGLAALHARGVFHRDLKPENVMITDEGSVRLLDFGLAREASAPLTDDDSPPPSSNAAPSLSSWGRSGTVGYMAPEQCDGRPLDARVDVFALGVVSYELIAGHRPFVGEDVRAIARATMQATPDFGEARWSKAPESLRAVTAKMLARDPAARFADGAAVVKALGETSRSPTKWASRRMWTVATSLVVALSAVLAFRKFAPRLRAIPPPPPGMVLVDEGTMTLGKSRDEIDRECAAIGKGCDKELMLRETPSARVEVPPFYLDVHEVTNAEMAAVLEANRGDLYVAMDEDEHFKRFVRRNRGLGTNDELIADLYPKHGGIEYDANEHYRARAERADMPAVQVTWYGANLFCRAKDKMLPTEDQWEAAARGHEDRPFPWGAAPIRCGEVAIPRDGLVIMPEACPARPDVVLRPVGTSPEDVTPSGITDLAGNALEWVDSIYVEGDRLAHPEPTAELRKVMRGGSFFESIGARTTSRNRAPAGTARDNLAFRCAALVRR